MEYRTNICQTAPRIYPWPVPKYQLLNADSVYSQHNTITACCSETSSMVTLRVLTKSSDILIVPYFVSLYIWLCNFHTWRKQHWMHWWSKLVWFPSLWNEMLNVTCSFIWVQFSHWSSSPIHIFVMIWTHVWHAYSCYHAEEVNKPKDSESLKDVFFVLWLGWQVD